MSQESHAQPPLFATQIDVGSGATFTSARAVELEQIRLLREILAAQDRQNELLEELVNQLNAAQRQKAAELGQWKAANPHLARSCRRAAETLGRVQTEFLELMTREINENQENLLESDFALNEFVDRFGPRFAHLNGLVQVLAQLSAPPAGGKPQNTA